LLYERQDVQKPLIKAPSHLASQNCLIVPITPCCDDEGWEEDSYAMNDFSFVWTLKVTFIEAVGVDWPCCDAGNPE